MVPGAAARPAGAWLLSGCGHGGVAWARWRVKCTPEKGAQEKASLRGIDDSFRKIVLVRDVVKPYKTNAVCLR